VILPTGVAMQGDAQPDQGSNTVAMLRVRIEVEKEQVIAVAFVLNILHGLDELTGDGAGDEAVVIHVFRWTSDRPVWMVEGRFGVYLEVHKITTYPCQYT